MSKQIILGIIILGIAIFGASYLSKNYKQIVSLVDTTGGFDPLSTTYRVDDTPVTLVNGRSETSLSPDSATKVVTRIVGKPAYGDLNGDGKLDAVVILAQNGGGTGTFYFTAVAVNTGNGSQGTNTIYLGDRISPQNTQIIAKQIVVNYTGRRAGEDFSVAPSIGFSKYITLEGLRIIEVQ